MSAPKWELRALDDLSGCWLYWESPAGGMAIEKREGGMRTGFSLSWLPNGGDDKTRGPYRSIEDAQAEAVKWCRRIGKKALQHGVKCMAAGA